MSVKNYIFFFLFADFLDHLEWFFWSFTLVFGPFVRINNSSTYMKSSLIWLWYSLAQIAPKSFRNWLNKFFLFWSPPRLKINPGYSNSILHLHSVLAFLPLYIFCMKCSYYDCNQPIFTRLAFLHSLKGASCCLSAKSRILFLEQCQGCFSVLRVLIDNCLICSQNSRNSSLIYATPNFWRDSEWKGMLDIWCRLGGRIQGFNQIQSQIWFSIVKFDGLVISKFKLFNQIKFWLRE